MKTLKQFAILPVLAALLSVSACMRDDSNPGTADPAAEPGSAQVLIRTGKIGRLAKKAAIELSRLEITLSAPGESTVVREFPLTGSGAATVSHTIPGLASLKPWTLAARSLDLNGRVIHSGSADFEVRPRQTAEVSLDLAALYSMLRASFYPVRDSVTRCELWIDGELRADTAFPKQSRLGDTIVLAYDYVGAAADHEFRMEAHGGMWGIDTLLYAGDTVLRVSAGVDAAVALRLPWVGPRTPPPGQAAMEVALGAVGTLLLNGRMEGAAEWMEIAAPGGPEGPVVNGSPRVAYDPGTNRLIVFYASNPAVGYREGQSSQVWVLSHANGVGGDPAWSRIPVAGSLPDNVNTYASVTYTPGNRLIVYGGCGFNCAPAQSTVHVLTNANGLGGPAVWSQVSVANPQARSSMEGAYHPGSNSLIAFGGNSAFFGTDRDDTRILSHADGTAGPSAWTTLAMPGLRPSPRSEVFGSGYDAANGRMIIFGGNSMRRTCCPYDIGQFNDTWVLRDAAGPGSPAWEELLPSGPLPDPRSSSAVTYDAAGNRLLVHGGYRWSNETQSSTNLPDLWQLEHANGLGGAPAWTRLDPTGSAPGAMSGHAAAFDSSSRRMLVVGSADPSKGERPRYWILAL